MDAKQAEKARKVAEFNQWAEEVLKNRPHRRMTNAEYVQMMQKTRSWG